MRALPQIKKDIEFNTGLTSLIEVLKLVAVSQFRALERKLKSFDALPSSFFSLFELIDSAKVKHPFTNPENQTCGVIAITSDVGLLGGLNMNVINTACAELTKTGGELIVIGERGQVYARERNVGFTGFKGINDQERFGQALQLQEWLVDRIVNKKMFCGLKIVYPRALSITVQRTEMMLLLPYVPSEKSKFRSELASSPGGIIYESDVGDIVEYAFRLYLTYRFFDIFGISRLAEFASRFIHLEESVERIKTMQVNLRRQYFRQRHEIIDRSMRELFTARSLFANKNS